MSIFYLLYIFLKIFERINLPVIERYELTPSFPVKIMHLKIVLRFVVNVLLYVSGRA